jgi:hypothetical protein
VGWWARGRKASGREIKIKREWTDRLHTVEEHSKRCLARAREEAELKLRALTEERDRLALRLEAHGLRADVSPETDDAPDAPLPDLGGLEPGSLLPAARMRPLRPRSSRNPNGHGDASPNDLQRIKGIGPAYERTLNELGYTTLEAIAGLDQRQIDELADRLGRRARPADWVAAASHLLGESRPSSS